MCSQELERLGLGEAVDLYVCEMPVEYQAVKRLLPSLWKENQPQVFKEMHTILQMEFCMHVVLCKSLEPLISLHFVRKTGNECSDLTETCGSTVCKAKNSVKF